MKRKLKMPKLLKFKPNKLRATAVRRPVRFAATAADYEEMAEPNMKLSRALLVVLLLHVVAVAGIIAFNAIKTRQGSILAASAPSVASNATTASSAATKPLVSNPPGAAAQKSNLKVTAKDAGKPGRAKQSETAKAPADSGRVYVVAKGDNPVTIAKKFKVSYDDLIALNHIDDPHKLRIGQKLLIPAKPEKPKKNGE
jgi:LysM repeat protein